MREMFPMSFGMQPGPPPPHFGRGEPLRGARGRGRGRERGRGRGRGGPERGRRDRGRGRGGHRAMDGRPRSFSHGNRGRNDNFGYRRDKRPRSTDLNETKWYKPSYVEDPWYALMSRSGGQFRQENTIFKACVQSIPASGPPAHKKVSWYQSSFVENPWAGQGGNGIEVRCFHIDTERNSNGNRCATPAATPVAEKPVSSAVEPVLAPRRAMDLPDPVLASSAAPETVPVPQKPNTSEEPVQPKRRAMALPDPVNS